MAVNLPPNDFTPFDYTNFVLGKNPFIDAHVGFTYTPTGDPIQIVVNESADDGSPDGAYASLLSFPVINYGGGTGELDLHIAVSSAFFEAHVGTNITFQFVVNAVDPITGSTDAKGIFLEQLSFQPGPTFNDPVKIQNDYSAITRVSLPSDQANTEAQAIVAGTTTERKFVDDLLAQAANTTIPAVAVEGSMYGAVGTSDEITKLATVFLPAQVANAIQNNLNPQVYACEALGLAFAFGDENGGTAFGNNFGPTASGMSATPAGDASFAAAAASAIFGAAATANTPGAILDFVSNWEAFFSGNGVPGIPHASLDQIVLAARGAAWGDAVGVALAGHLGPLPDQVINFLEDAARSGAQYSTSLASQPSHVPFQGGIPASAGAAAAVELIGVAAPDHLIM